MSIKNIPGRFLAAGAIIAVLSSGSLAVAAGEGGLLKGGVRNPSPDQSKTLTRETEIIADNNSYGTRQSNKSDNGGGAIYGCRSLEGGTPAGREPCIRSNNLSRGLSFEFETDGNLGGTIVAIGGDNAKPFTTNATGVATGLNADRVDGKNAEDLTKDALTQYQGQVRIAAVQGDGKLTSGRGATQATREAIGQYTVDFDTKIGACAQQATGRATIPRFVSLEQVDDDTIRVRTFDTTGAPDDTAFHLTVSC